MNYLQMEGPQKKGNFIAGLITLLLLIPLAGVSLGVVLAFIRLGYELAWGLIN